MAVSKRLLWIISPFLATIGLLIVLCGASLDMLSSARAFVGGESLWAKGQKEAVHALNRYAETRDEADYQRYLENIAAPLGDRKARLELSKINPDLVLARQGFLEGRNHPDDIAGMIRLFRRFRTVSFMAKAIDIWTEADGGIVELTGIAEELHRRIGSSDRSSARLRPLIERINDLNLKLTPLEDAFSYTLGEASRKTELILFAAISLLASALVVLAIALSRRMAFRNDKAELALRLSEERLNLAVKGSNDGLWDWDMVTGASYYSPHVNKMLGYGADDELAPRHEAFVNILHPEDAALSRVAMQAHLRQHVPYEMELRLKGSDGAYRWFLSRGQCVRDSQDRAVRMAGSLKDINDRKLAEAAVSRHARQQEMMAAFGQMALRNPEIDELMTRAVQIVDQGLHVEFCRALAASFDDLTLLLKGSSGWDAEWSQRLTFDSVAETEDRFIIGVREEIIVDDFKRETRFKPSAMLIAHNVRSGAEMLICGAFGSYGVLGIYSREVAQFTQESINFLHGITNTIASAMDRKMADDRLTHLAQFDPITDLPNRTLYTDRLWQTITQASRDKRPVGVLFIDLDRFKIINDTLGHTCGDEVLLQVAQRLAQCVRAGDTVGRLGGDEFAIALANLARAEDAGTVARKIGDALSRPFMVEGEQVYVSASLGISIYPIDGADPDTLLKNADTAMYRAKEAGRNTYQFYLSQMNQRAIERLKLETQLRGALDRGEFLLHYQPKVNLADGAITGFEALLRWQHPERGLVPPADFISILEDTALIIPVGDWVLATVCKQLKQWQAMGLRVQPVAVNLSARQFNQKNLDAVIGDIINAHGVAPGMLEFELTESMLMSDSEAAVRILKNMKAYGVRLSVDDFGTGYSSLAYLKRFPLDSLKIDRAFIRDVSIDADDATIAAAIINLAHNLKMNVVAEGVETEEQLDFLKGHGCDEMQGYYFARPMSVSDCTRALEEQWRLVEPKPFRLAISRNMAVVSVAA